MSGETVYSQTNCMCWMNDAVEMNTNTGGGMFAGIKRSLGGGGLFVTDFTARGNGHVAFAPRFPGTIRPVVLAAGQAVTSVALDVGYDSPSAFISAFRVTFGQTPGEYFRST